MYLPFLEWMVPMHYVAYSPLKAIFRLFMLRTSSTITNWGYLILSSLSHNKYGEVLGTLNRMPISYDLYPAKCFSTCKCYLSKHQGPVS